MYKYATFDQNIPSSSRVMRIFTERPLQAKMMLGEASFFLFIIFVNQWLGNVKINKYANFNPNIPFGSRVMSIFTKCTRPAELMLSEVSTTACQWLNNVDMHTYAKFGQNIPCGSRVMSISLNVDGRKDRQTDSETDSKRNYILHTCRLCNLEMSTCDLFKHKIDKFMLVLSICMGNVIRLIFRVLYYFTVASLTH